jgi:hypothetical protein
MEGKGDADQPHVVTGQRPRPAGRPAAAAAVAAAAAAGAGAAAGAAGAERAHRQAQLSAQHAVGSVVWLAGLKSAPQHNGKRCQILRFDGEKDRYKVELNEAGSEAKPARMMVKPANLTAIEPLHHYQQQQQQQHEEVEAEAEAEEEELGIGGFRVSSSTDLSDRVAMTEEAVGALLTHVDEAKAAGNVLYQSKDWAAAVRCEKRHFLRHLYIKCIILPRQARDKHRENSKKSGVFPQSVLCWLEARAGPRGGRGARGSAAGMRCPVHKSQRGEIRAAAVRGLSLRRAVRPGAGSGLLESALAGRQRAAEDGGARGTQRADDQGV